MDRRGSRSQTARRAVTPSPAFAPDDQTSPAARSLGGRVYALVRRATPKGPSSSRGIQVGSVVLDAADYGRAQLGRRELIFPCM